MEDNDLMSDVEYDHVKESKVDVAVLKPGTNVTRRKGTTIRAKKETRVL